MVAPFSLSKKEIKRKGFHVCLKCFFSKGFKSKPTEQRNKQMGFGKVENEPDDTTVNEPVPVLPNSTDPFIKALADYSLHMEKRFEMRMKELENKDEGEIWLRNMVLWFRRAYAEYCNDKAKCD